MGARDDIDVNIYEQAAHFAEIGAGISMLPRAWDILKKLGLDAVLEEVATNSPSDRPGTFAIHRLVLCLCSQANIPILDLIFQFRKSDQSEGFAFTEVDTKGKALYLSLYLRAN